VVKIGRYGRSRGLGSRTSRRSVGRPKVMGHIYGPKHLANSMAPRNTRVVKSSRGGYNFVKK